MEKVIKFRVWDKEEVRMVSPDYVNRHGEPYWKEEGIPTKGDKDALMQFTGLLDKNGKEIYEGDIVKSAMIYHGNPGTEFLSKIVYNSNIGAYQISYLNMNDAFVTDNIGFKYQLEIIGNIYENPDLLK